MQAAAEREAAAAGYHMESGSRQRRLLERLEAAKRAIDDNRLGYTVPWAAGTLAALPATISQLYATSIRRASSSRRDHRVDSYFRF